MTRTIFLTLSMLILFNQVLYSYTFRYDWNMIADSIATMQRAICDSIYYSKIDVYKNLRRGFSIKRYIDSTAVEGDTIIIMDYHNPSKLTTNCVTWVKGKPNSFLTYDEHLHINRDFTICYWSIYMRKLCEEWDVAQIRKEEKEHPFEPISPSDKADIIATRIILKSHGEFLINTILFEHFYLYPRDKF